MNVLSAAGAVYNGISCSNATETINGHVIQRLSLQYLCRKYISNIQSLTHPPVISRRPWAPLEINTAHHIVQSMIDRGISTSNAACFVQHFRNFEFSEYLSYFST